MKSFLSKLVAIVVMCNVVFSCRNEEIVNNKTVEDFNAKQYAEKFKREDISLKELEDTNKLQTTIEKTKQVLNGKITLNRTEILEGATIENNGYYMHNGESESYTFSVSSDKYIPYFENIVYYKNKIDSKYKV